MRARENKVGRSGGERPQLSLAARTVGRGRDGQGLDSEQYSQCWWHSRITLEL